jgi:branched-chain amino acid aminotransferase
VLTLARDAGYTVVEERMVRDRLYDADEVFLSGTAAEVIGVREVDFRTVGSGSIGPITRAVQQAFRQAVRGEHHRSPEWLEPVLPLDDEASAKILRA